MEVITKKNFDEQKNLILYQSVTSLLKGVWCSFLVSMYLLTSTLWEKYKESIKKVKNKLNSLWSTVWMRFDVLRDRNTNSPAGDRRWPCPSRKSMYMYISIKLWMVLYQFCWEVLEFTRVHYLSCRYKDNRKWYHIQEWVGKEEEGMNVCTQSSCKDKMHPRSMLQIHYGATTIRNTASFYLVY